MIKIEDISNEDRKLYRVYSDDSTKSIVDKGYTIYGHEILVEDESEVENYIEDTPEHISEVIENREII